MGGVQEQARANYTLIRERWPGVCDALEQGLDTFSVERLDGGTEPSLRLDGLQLTSTYNRLAEAQTQSQLVSEDAGEAWVYGPALGDVVRVLLERSGLARLHVVVLSIPCTRASLSHFDHTDWLADPRVTLELAGEARFGSPFAASPVELKLADAGALALRDQVLLELSYDFQADVFRARRQALQAQLEQNFERAAGDGDVAALYESARGQTVVVAGAGPTLTDQLGWIAAQREKLALFAVTTALRPLAERDLMPDVVVVVDPKRAVLSHFDGLELAQYSGVPLVYVPTVHPDVVAAWPGPRLLAYVGGDALHAPLAAELPRGSLYCSGTVTHAAVDLAVKAGAARVVLAGVDFAYPSYRGHASGAADNDTEHVARTRLRVQNGRGQPVPSDARMIGFLRDLERYIAQRSGVTFVHAGRDGAEIAGTVWMEDSHAA